MVQVMAWESFGSFSNCKKLNSESEIGSQYIKKQAKTEGKCRDWKYFNFSWTAWFLRWQFARA